MSNRRLPVSIRMAFDADGERIRELVSRYGQELLDLDWSSIEPFWTVAEMPQSGIVGAIQYCPGKPVCRLEYLCVAPELSHVQRAMVVKSLAYAGMALGKTHGAQMASFLIPDDLKSYTRILTRRGAAVIQRGNMIVKRL